MSYSETLSLKNTLDNVLNKEDRIVGLPNTPEEFQKLPSVLQYHYWYNKPNVQQILRRAGLEDLESAKTLTKTAT